MGSSCWGSIQERILEHLQKKSHQTPSLHQFWKATWIPLACLIFCGECILLVCLQKLQQGGKWLGIGQRPTLLAYICYFTIFVMSQFIAGWALLVLAGLAFRILTIQHARSASSFASLTRFCHHQDQCEAPNTRVLATKKLTNQCVTPIRHGCLGNPHRLDTVITIRSGWATLVALGAQLEGHLILFLCK